MKKLFLLALTCSLFAVGTANAQTETYYGGKQGSFAITVGADPVINFVGNMFNGTQNNSLEGLAGSLAGKYFVSDQFSLKAEVRFDNSKNIGFEYNPEDKDYKDIIGKDTEGSRAFALGIGAQYNFRSGKRLQPFIGADFFYERTNSNYNIQESFDATYEDRWGDKIDVYDSYKKVSYPTNAFGFVANLGVEYFLGKSVSISAALDLGVYSYNQKDVSKYETDDRDITNEQIEAQNYNIKKSKGTTFKTGLMNGNIAFNFYF